MLDCKGRKSEYGHVIHLCWCLFFFLASSMVTSDSEGFIIAPRSTPNLKNHEYTSSGPNFFTCLAWVALSGAYAPTSIAFRVIGARKSHLHDKAVAYRLKLVL